MCYNVWKSTNKSNWIGFIDSAQQIQFGEGAGEIGHPKTWTINNGTELVEYKAIKDAE